MIGQANCAAFICGWVLGCGLLGWSFAVTVVLVLLCKLFDSRSFSFGVIIFAFRVLPGELVFDNEHILFGLLPGERELVDLLHVTVEQRFDHDTERFVKELECCSGQQNVDVAREGKDFPDLCEFKQPVAQQLANNEQNRV